MNRIVLKSLIVAIGLAAGAAHAGCPEPTPVNDVPKGATASRDDMMAAQRAIKAYDSAVKAYTDCLQAAGEPPTKGNEAVDKLTKIAQEFNTELRAFKEKNGSG